MQLTKLEIRGFKSFGDKVVVNFNDGITGIVGPNGCGKSNIVDAIRWVLGEQKTKALRSDKMENVIFNGTKNRKPLQMAEVSLSFNNTKNLLPTEFSQVTVTRRYYRSGESEYLLNNVNCRLKDINDLFLDTGIGSDSYAIIELKMVDDILNDKDNSRRNLFEEAAGISKFKLRKKQTLKKLGDTDKDLERVEDVLFEIEKNLKSLERQAKQTEKHATLREEYKRLSIALANVKLGSFKDELQALQDTLLLKQEEKVKISNEHKKLIADLEKHKTELLKKEKLLASRQKTLNEHVNNIRQHESDKKIKNERHRFLNDKVESLKTQIDLDKETLKGSFKDIKNLTENQSHFEANLKDMNTQLNELEEEREAFKEQGRNYQEQINTVNQEFRREQEKLFELKKSLEVNESRLNSLKEELDKTTNDEVTQNDSVELIKKKLKEAVSQINEETERLETLKKEETKLETLIKEQETLLENEKSVLVKSNRTIDSKQNEYNLTKSLVDNLEGFPEAIKFLKKSSNWTNEAHLVSDIVTCEEPYRIAIENYLEPYMNYYVVENEEQALNAIKILGNASKGKANFFILDKFKKFKAVPSKKFTDCKEAISLVEYDPIYKEIISFLLNDIYIVEHETSEVPSDSSAVFLSKTGKFIHRPKSISGGSVGLFEGKRLGRAKNLEKLHGQIKTLSTKRDSIKAEIETKQHKLQVLKDTNLKKRIGDQQAKIAEANENYISCKLKDEQLQELLKSNSVRQEDIQKNIKILEEGVQKNKPRLDLEMVAVNNLSEQINVLNATLSEHNEMLQARSNAFNEQNIAVHQQKNKIESSKKEISFKESNVEKTEQRITKNQQDLSHTEKEIQGILGKENVNDEDLIALYKEKEDIEQGVTEAEKGYYALRSEIDNFDLTQKEELRNLENNAQSILETQNSINEKKLTLSATKERLKVEFNVDINQLLFDKEEEQSSETLESLETKINSTKSKIDKIGPINPMAIEAFEEIKTRYDFIIEQRKDLTDSKSSLMETIKEIDQVAKANFNASFLEIKENFQTVFRSLFTNDDNCDLSLSDPDLPLESSIDIIAKPKGKRPLTINQLSGGEKTLTAVALLFAIYLIKPAPFCIFDEVDAPLDDANIDKFNNIIRKFSKDSQFILVTHNKRTMSTTDVIYGVTMQEMGVSKLIPVDFRSLDKFTTA